MATYYRVNLKDKKNNIIYPNIHNKIVITQEGKIGLPINGGGYYSHGMNLSNASLYIKDQLPNEHIYSPFFSVKTLSGNYFTLGGLKDEIGFHIFHHTRTENGVDGKLSVNTETSDWTLNKTLSIPGNLYLTDIKTATPDSNKIIFGNLSTTYACIRANTSGSVILSTSKTDNEKSIIYAPNENCIRPGATKVFSLGTSSLKFNNIYANNANFEGTGTFSKINLSGSINSSLTTSTHIAGNQGTAIINSTAAANTYTMLARQKSTNGVFTLGVWGGNYNLFYTGNTKINNNENNYDKRLILLDESGNSNFPGNITAKTFNSTYFRTATINASFSTKFRTQTKGDTATSSYISAIRNNTASVNYSPQHGSGLAFGVYDTHGYIYFNYSTAGMSVGAGNADKLNWMKSVAFTDGTIAKATNADNATKWNNQVYDGGTVNHTDTWIPVFNNGKMQHTLRVIATSKTHTNYNTDQGRLATLAFLSFWNGAYNSTNNSNLTYAHQGTIQCKPTNLYNNTSGSNGTITLSQTAANFTYLKIYYRDDDNEYSEKSCYSPNGKIIPLSISNVRGNLCNIKARDVKINGTSVSNYTDSGGTVRFGEFVWYEGGSQKADVILKIWITRIDGYK